MVVGKKLSEETVIMIKLEIKLALRQIGWRKIIATNGKITIFAT